MRKLILGVLLIASPAAALENWNTQDIVLESVGASLHLVDWSQTIYISRNGHNEANPILGQHAPLGKIHLYFAGTLALHVTVAALLPRPYRTIWQSIWIGVEAGAVSRNFSLGVQLSWP